MKNEHNMNLPPTDLDGLKNFYEAISRKQMEDPVKAYKDEEDQVMTSEGPSMPAEKLNH